MSEKHLQWKIHRDLLGWDIVYIHVFVNLSVCEHFCSCEREIYRTWRLSIMLRCSLQEVQIIGTQEQGKTLSSQAG